MQPVQLRRGCRRADGWSSCWHTSWFIQKKMLMINTLLYTTPSFKMTQRWSFWKWRELGLMGIFRNLLGLLLSSKVPSNGKRSTQCTPSLPILSSGNRWGTICHWHVGPHTRLMPGEQSWKTVLLYQDGLQTHNSFSFQKVHDSMVWKSGCVYWTFFSPSIE